MKLTDLQTEKYKVMYRFPPDNLVPFLLREWLVYRPLQVYIARSLQMQDLADRLHYLVFPSLYKSLDTSAISNMLESVTMRHLEHKIGLRNWRSIEATFTRGFCDHRETFQVPAHYSQRGHTYEVGINNYRLIRKDPAGVPEHVIDSQHDVS